MENKEMAILKVVVETLANKDLDFKVCTRSEEFQVELNGLSYSPFKGIVINRSHSKGKDVVVFVGDLGFDLSMSDFKHFLDENEHVIGMGSFKALISNLEEI